METYEKFEEITTTALLVSSNERETMCFKKSSVICNAFSAIKFDGRFKPTKISHIPTN